MGKIAKILVAERELWFSKSSRVDLVRPEFVGVVLSTENDA